MHNWERNVIISAAKNNNYHKVKMLLDLGYGKKLVERDWKTIMEQPLRNACQSNDAWQPIIELVEKGFDLHVKYGFQKTLLHLAVEYNQLELVELILKKGIVINAKDYSGKTALHYAVLDSSDQMIFTLLKYNPDVNAKDNNNDTILYRALKRNSFTVIYALQEQGANVYEALLLAIKRDKTDSISAILKHFDLDLNEIYDEKFLFLNVAIQYADLKVIEHLIILGADVNEKDAFGRSPLHIAAEYTLLKEALFLIAHGADVNTLDILERTPLDLSYNINPRDRYFRKILRSHNAEYNVFKKLE
jgi:ankyrin repeat protein